MLTVTDGLHVLLTRLKELDAAQLAPTATGYPSIKTLIHAIEASCRRALKASRQAILDYLNSDECLLLAHHTKLMVSREDVDTIIAIAQYDTAIALSYLRRVNQTGAQYPQLTFIVPIISLLSDNMQYQMSNKHLSNEVMASRQKIMTLNNQLRHEQTLYQQILAAYTAAQQQNVSPVILGYMPVTTTQYTYIPMTAPTNNNNFQQM